MDAVQLKHIALALSKLPGEGNEGGREGRRDGYVGVFKLYTMTTILYPVAYIYMCDCEPPK